MQRYLTLIEIISQLAPCTAILDVGCGEGIFTKYLTGFAREVVGIDVSPTAIQRAKMRVARASFHSAALEDFQAERRFDLVIAVEMLYYVESVDTALEKLQALGKTLIVTYAHQRKRLDSHLDRFCDQSSRRFYSFWGTKGFTLARLSSRLEEEPNGTFDSRGITDLYWAH
jgi:cyclopropane fatty-acyl-phospholipid synthase-like methyltransferase